MSLLLKFKIGIARVPFLGPFIRQTYQLATAPLALARSARTELPRLGNDLSDVAERLTRVEYELRDLKAMIDSEIRSVIDPRIIDQRFAELRAHADASVQTSVGQTVQRLDLRMQGLEQRTAEVMDRGDHEWGASRRSYTELAHRLSLLLEDVRKLPAGSSRPELQEKMAGTPDPLLTTFYATFEDRFRGSREDIRERVSVFLPEAQEAVKIAAGAGPIVDLGCGRGEWLEVLSRAGIRCLGVDNNEAQLASARAHGLPVLNADALAWLKEQPPASVPMISAFHLIEHLPFPVLTEFASEVMRVLTPGGLALFETPNPESLLVGAFSFHLDPTHIKPLPPELTTCLMEVLGFTPVTIRPLHPHPWRDRYLREKSLPPDVARLLFGPRDYAVLARKPGV
ncbi:class I SAM-dependent methyltransferase [Chelatococcus asaccharovorans]|uniref:Methyltransferase family protein n=1 Tax=Chelatococcus asaccharovorans TaxID=28210 RepID=A0A2V3U6F5_9HYPH|nr:class I SAM-dependent methyltransferase [Chelatococcus asaccharovorans]MBS7703920.1 class I SAM-dependent methyltransferase [Chelatococcus asaccharovorans]PXW58084.1 methyltransferase family protein [Chelatococcus asaccharovorans]CAH1667625.1 Methyltransferase family protein [Chelatococcus asaccharovorans]CAH1680815.1 Methyltransferase family protein [Chelatococcus asaccharovorans]